jgi:hypothetical protein
MEARDVLFFDKMIVPKVIQVLYWFLLAASVLGGLGVMFAQSFFAGLVAIILGPLFVRIWCELLIVMFKMNEALQAIRNKP